MPKPDDGSGVTEADVATIEVEFREPGTNEIIQDTVVVNYPMAPWETALAGYWDATDVSVVHKSFVMLNIFVGLQNAVAAYHNDDDAPGAIAAIERLVAAVEDYNEEIGDLDMELDVELLNQLRDVMFANGIPQPPPPTIPLDPWPAD